MDLAVVMKIWILTQDKMWIQNQKQKLGTSFLLKGYLPIDIQYPIDIRNNSFFRNVSFTYWILFWLDVFLRLIFFSV